MNIFHDTHYRDILSTFQRENLEKLAAFLERLKPSESGLAFKMGDYLALDRDEDIYVKIAECHGIYRQAKNHPDCGAAACAIGHAPLAGIEILDSDKTWDGFCDRVFLQVEECERQSSGHPLNTKAWTFVFGPSHMDCPKAAARRIHHFLTYGVPRLSFTELRACEVNESGVLYNYRTQKVF